MQCKVRNSKGERCDKEVTYFFAERTCSGHQGRLVRWGTYDADKPLRQYTKVGLNRSGPLQPGRTPVEKFWNLVVKQPGCWGWKGTRDRRGQPTHSDGKVQKTAAQFMWMQTRGPIPAGAIVRKSCKNTNCINPDHLYLQEVNRREEVAA